MTIEQNQYDRMYKSSEENVYSIIKSEHVYFDLFSLTFIFKKGQKQVRRSAASSCPAR